MADGCIPSGDPDHGLVMGNPSEASVPNMFAHQLGYNSIPDSVLSSPFSQHRAHQDPYEHSDSAPAPAPLVIWWKNNDGPWVPPNFATGCDGRNASRMNGLDTGAYPFAYPGQYRDACVPSECGTTPTGIEPSDSGYGSNGAKLSVANNSVLGDPLDRCPETQSLAGHLSDLNFRPVLDSGQTGMWPAQQSPVDYRTNALDSKSIVCETCHKPVKTNSELKKHTQRHTKPHRCLVPGCNRTEGFSTSNDLDRHKRSVHPDETVAGNRYQCPIGPCKSKEKVWPRADNFRAHMKRVHNFTDVSDEALEPYIYRPQQLAQDESIDDTTSHQPLMHYDSGVRQLSSHLETGFTPSLYSENTEQAAGSSLHHESYNGMTLPAVPVGSTHMDLGHMTGGTGPVDHVVTSPSEDGRLSMTDHLEDISSSAVQTSQLVQDHPPASMDPAGRQSPLQFIMPGDLDHSDCTPRFSVSAEIESARSLFESPGEAPLIPAAASPELLVEDEPDASETSSVSVLDVPNHRGVQGDTSQGTQRTGPVAQAHGPIQLDLDDPESIRKVVEALETHGKLRELGYKKGSPTQTSKTEDSAARLRHENQYQCDAANCDKTFARLCELKKHAKRHSKPYGCTYQGCNKRFGSKNDWKRHENSQHFLLEVWKCEEPLTNKSSESCGKVSHRRETFKDHLIRYHGLHGRIVDTKLDKCRVGRNCEARFWCGFCEQIVEIQRKGLGAWTERFNHIDNHIHGKNGSVQKDMDEWKSVDPDAPPPSYGSGSDTDDDDGLRLAPPHSAWPTREPRQGYTRNTETSKRKRIDMEHDERQLKKARQDQPLSGVISCCQCGEGNSRNGPQCVSSECQHRLCGYCV